MSKIVKVYTLMNVQKSLLQTINGGPQIEEGVWDNILGKVGAQRKPKPEETPNAATRSDNTIADSALQDVLTRILDEVDGFKTYGLYVSAGNLSSTYLKTGSRKDMADRAARDSALSAHLVLFPTPTFSNFISKKPSASTNRMVLMHIPDQLHNQYKAATDEATKSAALEKMYNLKYYTLSLNLEELVKIHTALDAATTMADKAKLLDPVVIENIPNIGLKNQMRGEWAKLQNVPAAPSPEEAARQARKAALDSDAADQDLEDAEVALQARKTANLGRVAASVQADILRIATNIAIDKSAKLGQLRLLAKAQTPRLTDAQLAAALKSINDPPGGLQSVSIQALIDRLVPPGAGATP